MQQAMNSNKKIKTNPNSPHIVRNQQNILINKKLKFYQMKTVITVIIRQNIGKYEPKLSNLQNGALSINFVISNPEHPGVKSITYSLTTYNYISRF